MRTILVSLLAAVASAQSSAPVAAKGPTTDPAYAPLSEAYTALRAKDYDRAIIYFLRASALAPAKTSIRKDLAYTYLKTGDSEAARDQFGAAMRLDPADFHVALEYAFLCYETPDREGSPSVTFKAEARRIFDRIRKTGDAESRVTAEQAFQNVDGPLATGIARWTEAITTSESFSAHYDLASLAEQRDELDLAAEHYLKAWRMLPARKSVLLDYGRTLKNSNHTEDANAALLTASRGGEPRAAELARALLPDRYPFVYEFRRALTLDPKNIALRRELAYLLLRMADKKETDPADAEAEFRAIVDQAPDDLLSTAQLGFIYLARNENDRAMPLLERVLKGPDDELANRVRIVLHMPPKLQKRASTELGSDARVMAERSLQAGYLQDAVKYLTLAHEADPGDLSLALKLGQAYNQLHDDATAIRWFDMARQSEDSEVAAQAHKSYEALRPSLAVVRTTIWSFPFYSSRWKDIFAYGQAKTEFRLGKLPFKLYLSTRFIGDTRQTISTAGLLPQGLSESAFILGAGIATRTWHNSMAWFEAGSMMSYRTGHILPDYRGGVSWWRAHGTGIGSDERGFFRESNADVVFVSRFDKDTLGYLQNRVGYTPALTGALKTQFFLNANITADLKRQYWANFAEMGPGFRFRMSWMPPSLLFSVSYLRGIYLVNQGNPRRPNFTDLRAGFWYAFTH